MFQSRTDGLFSQLSRTMRIVLYIGPHICFVRTTYLCCEDHPFVLLEPPNCVVKTTFCFVQTTYLCCKDHHSFCGYKDCQLELYGPPYIMWFYKDRLFMF